MIKFRNRSDLISFIFKECSQFLNHNFYFKLLVLKFNKDMGLDLINDRTR
jgi:hypothetical protein